MNVKLVMAKGQARGHTIQLREATNIVGRQRECQVRIPSADVSRRHCVLSFEDGYLYAEDLGSTNGTFINGERIAGKEVVQPGDLLEVGPATFVVKYEAPQAAGSDVGAIPLLDALEEIAAGPGEKTVKFDPRARANQSEPVEEIDGIELVEEVDQIETVEDVEVLEEAPEEIPNIQFDMDKESLHLPKDRDFRDLLSGLDGK